MTDDDDLHAGDDAATETCKACWPGANRRHCSLD